LGREPFFFPPRGLLFFHLLFAKGRFPPLGRPPEGVRPLFSWKLTTFFFFPFFLFFSFSPGGSCSSPTKTNFPFFFFHPSFWSWLRTSALPPGTGSSPLRGCRNTFFPFPFPLLGGFTQGFSFPTNKQFFSGFSEPSLFFFFRSPLGGRCPPFLVPALFFLRRPFFFLVKVTENFHLLFLS